MASLSFSGHAATNNNKVTFQRRISRSRKLETGRYTLIITTVDAGGQHAKPQRLTFTIAP